MSSLTRPPRRTVLAGLALGVLALPAIGQDAREPIEGGIGGTGIVGTVTALGSIRINGLRVETPEDVPVLAAGLPVTLAEIGPGHSLTIEASGPLEALVARRIVVDHALVGAIGAVSPDGRSLRVLGTEVVLEPGVHLGVDVGARVAVSGLWRDGRVVASRIDGPLGAGQDSMAAEVAVGPTGLMLGGLPLSGPALPQPGTFATAIGWERGGAMIVDRLIEGRFTGAAGPLDRLVVEGYLEATAAMPRFAISGLGHSVDDAAQLARVGSTRAVFFGPYIGTFAVEGALPLPEGRMAREAYLAGTTPTSGEPQVIPTR